MARPSRDGSSRPDIPGSAGYLLLKAAKVFDHELDVCLGELDLTARQFLTLALVSGDDDLHQIELSRRLDLDPTLVGALIDDLESRGLVGRRRDPADRRRSIVALTPAGRRAYERAAAVATRAEADLLAPLTAADRRTLRNLLRATMSPRLAWLTSDA